LIFDVRSGSSGASNTGQGAGQSGLDFSDSATNNYFGAGMLDRNLIHINEKEVSFRSKVGIRENSKEHVGNPYLA